MTRAGDATSDEWRKLEALWETVLELPPDQRDSFLAASTIDRGLREEIESLLGRENAAEAFFDRLSAVVPQPAEAIAAHQADSAVTADAAGSPTTSAHAAVDPLVGSTLGHHQIMARLGQGGMGVVYRALDLRLRRTVALKLLRAQQPHVARANERLLVEARAAAALDHPNICTIYEVGETPDGSAFIAMAFYPGETLEAVMQRGPLPLGTALDYATQIARGLGAAHARGIIHRDVKPANVIITTDGSVKLLDFGIARVPDVNVSREGVMPGTIAYMSPEQVTSRPVDQRTDLWALGVVLYEMCAGERPFDGESAGAVLHSILQDAPRAVSTIRQELPGRIDSIVARLLAKNPDQRYPRTTDLISDLTAASVDRRPVTRMPPRDDGSGSIVRDSDRDEVGSGRSPATLPARPRRSSLRWAASIGAVLSVAVGIASWLLTARDERTPPTDASSGSRVPSIAVVPVRTFAADSLDALAEAMTQELISVLGREPDKLRTISSSSVVRFRDGRTDPRAIAESLGVAHVLEGHVQRVSAGVRVSVRLIDGRDGSMRWSGTYDEAYRDIAAAIANVAGAVADTLHVRLTRASANGLLSDGAQGAAIAERRVAARDLFFQGRRETLFRTESGRREVRRFYTLAIETDSTFALGHAGMALCLAGPCPADGEPRERLLARAERHARKAMALDSLSAESHGALGRVMMSRYKFAEAEMRLRHALELDPTRTSFRDFLIWLYIFTDRPRDALAEAERRVRDDPLSPNAIAELARAYLVNARCDDAMAQLDMLKGLDIPPARAARIAAQCLGRRGLWADAVDVMRPTAERNPAEGTANYGFLLARAGRWAEARAIRDSLQVQWRRGTAPAFPLVVIHAGLRDFDEAFEWLDKAVADRSVNAEVMEPMFEELRRDVRFDGIRKKLGITPPVRR